MKKGNFSKWLIVSIIFMNIAFTVSILYIFLQTSAEPSTLIGCWFAFTTTELWALASIKKKKVEKGGSDNENY